MDLYLIDVHHVICRKVSARFPISLTDDMPFHQDIKRYTTIILILINDAWTFGPRLTAVRRACGSQQIYSPIDRRHGLSSAGRSDQLESAALTFINIKVLARLPLEVSLGRPCTQRGSVFRGSCHRSPLHHLVRPPGRIGLEIREPMAP